MPSSERNRRSISRLIKSFIPIFDWLPKYKWKTDLHGDLIAGLTVGVMHVPQGMAYASLAGVPPVYGMYSSFFASTIYMLFGTSRHISIGVFAVASMMVGAARLRLAPTFDPANNHTIPPLGEYVDPLVFTSALTFLVGIVQLVMGVVRLGFLTTYLSDPLLSGFTTGAAFHVFTSQLNKIFGVQLPRHEGIGMIVRMWIDVILSLGNVNYTTLAISIFGLAFLNIGKSFINPMILKFSPVPAPLELILVIIGVLVSQTLNLHEKYGVKIVETVPNGFPTPSIPRFDILPHLLSDAIPIAVVCYMFVMSMGKLFAKKHKYKTDPNQELYACGISSTMSAFFPVYPVGASLSRSSICEMSGANTLLYTLFSSSLLLTFIMFLGPLLEPLPMCILACNVIVSLKSLFLQVNDLPRLWRISKYDFSIWIVACLSTIFTNVTMGLIISLPFALFTLVLRQQWPSFSDSPYYDDTEKQVLPENTKVVRFEAPLNFANVNSFLERMTEIINIKEKKDVDLLLLPKPPSRTILVDCTPISYVDVMGLSALKEIFQDAAKQGVDVYYCALPENVLSILRLDPSFNTVVPQGIFFPSIDRCLLSTVHSK